MPPRRRLDNELVRRGLAATREEAQEAVRQGLVLVDGAPANKPSSQVHAAQALTFVAPPRTYVSRGGDKLVHALDRFDIDVVGRRCLDAGASTGGFTDCLLQRGADSVIAVDVGHAQLHERLRGDPRVVVLERTNVRELRPEDVPPPPPTFVTADVSFISLGHVLPALRSVADASAAAVVLVKPQFEAGREHVPRGGVVRDPQVWRDVLASVMTAASHVGWHAAGVTASPLLGPAGNAEFLLHLRPDRIPFALDHAVDEAVAEASMLREGRT